MQITLVTPAGKASRSGNRTTAVRWARILRDLGHRVRVAEVYDGSDCDLLIAIHAWRSAASIEDFHARYPDRPSIVLLAGTDIYRFQESDPETTHRSMELATALVGLHDLVDHAIPARFAAKLHIIHQSAAPLPSPRAPHVRHFDVLVAGHLREEKDSLRAAFAVRDLPSASRLRVVLLGKAHDETWRRMAEKEMARNPRLDWRGEVPPGQVRRAMATSRALVISSVMEGGANIVSEAVAAGLPVIASDIDGNVGLLGADYAGYYPVRDTDALRRVLLRAESDAKFLKALERQCRARVKLFAPARERADWKKLLRDLQGAVVTPQS